MFPVPGDGRYLVQPVHIDDFADLCVEAARDEGNPMFDAAGPGQLAFEDLVHAVRRAVRSRVLVLHVPARAMLAAARASGFVVRDVVLTADEIRGLTAGLLASDQAPRARLGFTKWLSTHAESLGRSYANELQRHFDTR